MYKTIQEGKAKLYIPKEEKISKKLAVFYNPIMKHNRDISVLILDSLEKKKNIQIADILAGSGVRGIRFFLELNKNKIKEISINDINKESFRIIKKNLKLNKINKRKIRISNEEANKFLLNSNGFDYIDIDPFGSPNPFLDCSIKRLARDGILAVTATDTGCLCGSFPKACIRKYWAVPLRNEIMHEFGLRILIRKIQLIAAQYEKALIPVFSYSKEHYFRIFLKYEKGKDEVNKVLKQHELYDNFGPIWTGRLWDKNLADNVFRNLLKNRILSKDKHLSNFLNKIKDESRIDAIGFYDIHKICKKYAIKQILKKDIIKNKIKEMGYKASNTHFNDEAIRSNIKINELVKILKCQKFSTSF